MKHNEFNDLAAQMEAACGDWENSEGLSEKTLSELIAKVEAMDAAENEKKHPEPVAKKPVRLKKRYIFVLAAALALAMGTGVVGDRVWISDSQDLERESEITTKVNNEDKKSVLLEEEEIHQEIATKLGIASIRLGYMPDGMVLDSYTIVEDTGWAYVYYLFDDNVIIVQMAKDNIEVSSNVQWDGSSVKIENFKNEHGFQIDAYCVDEEYSNYAAGMTYANGYYNIFGCFTEEEQFIKILENIYFKNM